MTHKILCVVVVAFLPGAEAQINGAITIACAYFIAILWIKPYLRKGDDRLAQFAQSELLMFLLAGRYLLTSVDEGALEYQTLTVILILGFCCFSLYFLSALVYNIMKMVSIDSWCSKKLQGIVKVVPPSLAEPTKRMFTNQKKKDYDKLLSDTMYQGIANISYDVAEKYAIKAELVSKDQPLTRVQLTGLSEVDEDDADDMGRESNSGMVMSPVLHALRALQQQMNQLGQSAQGRVSQMTNSMHKRMSQMTQSAHHQAS